MKGGRQPSPKTDSSATTSKPNEPCKNMCGFYGSDACDGLCSVCYKAKQQQIGQTEQSAENDSSAAPVGPQKTPSPGQESSPLVDPTAQVAPESALIQPDEQISKEKDDSGTSTKKRAGRCQICGKKLGLTEFACDCGGFYCGLHRYADTHNCTFDYRTHGRAQIAKNNPAVHGEKVPKI